MMRRTDMTWSQLKVGIVILLALAAVLYLIMNLTRGAGVFTPASAFRATLNDSQGIKVGASVQIRGVNVGNVKQVAIDSAKGQVAVHFTVSSEILPLLHRDAAVRIRPMGLLGDKYLDLLPGSPQQPPLPEGAALSESGNADTDFSGVAGSAATALKTVDQTLRELQEILGNIKAGKGTAGRLVTDPALYDQTTRLMRKVNALAEKTNQMLVRIEKGDGTLGKLVSDRTLYDRATLAVEEMQKLGAMLNQPDGVLGRLAGDRALYQRLESVIDKGEVLAGKIERGEGTLGKLITQDQLYTRADKVLTDVESLIADIKKDPERFFRFSVF